MIGRPTNCLPCGALQTVRARADMLHLGRATAAFSESCKNVLLGASQAPQIFCAYRQAACAIAEKYFLCVECVPYTYMHMFPTRFQRNPLLPIIHDLAGNTHTTAGNNLLICLVQLVEPGDGYQKVRLLSIYIRCNEIPTTPYESMNHHAEHLDG